MFIRFFFLNISYLKTDECFYELLLCSTLSRLLVHEKLFHAKQKKCLQRPFTPENPVPLPLPWFSLNLNRIRKYRSLFYTHKMFITPQVLTESSQEHHRLGWYYTISGMSVYSHCDILLLKRMDGWARKMQPMLKFL